VYELSGKNCSPKGSKRMRVPALWLRVAYILVMARRSQDKRASLGY